MSIKKTGDEILQSYISQCEELTREIEKLESLKKERERFEIAIELLQKELKSSSIQDNDIPTDNRIRTPQPYIIDLVADYLIKQQKPCTLKDIVNYILSTGYTHQAKIFSKSVGSAICAANKKFKRVGPSLWALTEWNDN